MIASFAVCEFLYLCLSDCTYKYHEADISPGEEVDPVLGGSVYGIQRRSTKQNAQRVGECRMRIVDCPDRYIDDGQRDCEVCGFEYRVEFGAEDISGKHSDKSDKDDV